jgi:hypothetical protein
VVDDIMIYSCEFGGVNQFTLLPGDHHVQGVATADGGANPSVNTVDVSSATNDWVIQYHIKGSDGGNWTNPASTNFSNLASNNGADWVSSMTKDAGPAAASSSTSYTGAGTDEDGGSIFIAVDDTETPDRTGVQTLADCIATGPTHEINCADISGAVRSFIETGSDVNSSIKRPAWQRSTTDKSDIAYRATGPSDTLPYAIGFRNGTGDSGFNIGLALGISSQGKEAWATTDVGTSFIVFKPDVTQAVGGYLLNPRNTGLGTENGWYYWTPTQTGAEGRMDLVMNDSSFQGPRWRYEHADLSSASWITMAFSQPGAGDARLMYVNGIDVTASMTQAGSAPIDENDWWGDNLMSGTGFGNLYLGADSTTFDFTGDISYIAEWSTVLTPAEILALHNCALGVEAATAGRAQRYPSMRAIRLK